jgi:hypothetical protein
MAITLLAMIAVFVGIGFVIGYLVGRRRGEREARQGFPVLPAASKDRP